MSLGIATTFANLLPVGNTEVPFIDTNGNRGIQVRFPVSAQTFPARFSLL